MKYLISIHLIGWFIAEILESFQVGMAFAEKQKPIPVATERLANTIELFFWEFTLVPALIGAVLAGWILAGRKKDDK